jgi:Kef-type K+ transport system membrane component KefB
VIGRRPSTARNGRTQLALLLAIALVLGAPLVGQSVLGARTAGVVNGGDSSAPEHLSGLGEGLVTLQRHPLGAGLGTGPGEQGRFGVDGVTSENAYIEIGNQLGIAMMVLYVAVLLSAIRALGRRRDDELGAWLFVGGIGLALGGLFLHVWNFELALTFWTGVGLALRPAPDVQASSDAPRDTSVRNS